MTTYLIDDNLELTSDNDVACRHCGTAVGTRHDVLDNAVRQVGPMSHDDDLAAASQNYVDRRVVVRQAFCPGCFVQLQYEVVPEGEENGRTLSLSHGLWSSQAE